MEVVVSRGRVRHHHRQLADLRHKGDAGNGQRVERVLRYYGNGAEAGKGWGKRGSGHGAHSATGFPSDFFTARRNLAGPGIGHMARMGVVVIVGDSGRGNVRCGSAAATLLLASVKGVRKAGVVVSAEQI